MNKKQYVISHRLTEQFLVSFTPLKLSQRKNEQRLVWSDLCALQLSLFKAAKLGSISREASKNYIVTQLNARGEVQRRFSMQTFYVDPVPEPLPRYYMSYTTSFLSTDSHEA